MWSWLIECMSLEIHTHDHLGVCWTRLVYFSLSCFSILFIIHTHIPRHGYALIWDYEAGKQALFGSSMHPFWHNARLVWHDPRWPSVVGGFHWQHRVACLPWPNATTLAEDWHCARSVMIAHVWLAGTRVMLGFGLSVHWHNAPVILLYVRVHASNVCALLHDAYPFNPRGQDHFGRGTADPGPILPGEDVSALPCPASPDTAPSWVVFIVVKREGESVHGRSASGKHVSWHTFPEDVQDPGWRFGCTHVQQTSVWVVSFLYADCIHASRVVIDSHACPKGNNVGWGTADARHEQNKDNTGTYAEVQVCCVVRCAQKDTDWSREGHGGGVRRRWSSSAWTRKQHDRMRMRMGATCAEILIPWP